MDGRAEAVEACRQWAKLRIDETIEVMVPAGDGGAMTTIGLAEAIPEFDAQMFRLGEKVFTAEGEVTNVKRL